MTDDVAPFLQSALAKQKREDAMQALWAICEKFIEDQHIHCAETIYQTDRVIENAYDFIENICEIVGYKSM